MAEKNMRKKTCREEKEEELKEAGRKEQEWDAMDDCIEEEKTNSR